MESTEKITNRSRRKGASPRVAYAGHFLSRSSRFCRRLSIEKHRVADDSPATLLISNALRTSPHLSSRHLHFVFLAGKETRNALAVLIIFRILATADLFRQRRTSLEQDHQQQRTDHAPVENADSGGDGKEVEAHPDRLFGEIVGMAAPSPEARGVESFVVWSG